MSGSSSYSRIETGNLGYAGDICVRFDYHMFGNAIGSLSVMVGSNTVWTQTGNQGDRWQSVEVDASLPAEAGVRASLICTLYMYSLVYQPPKKLEILCDAKCNIQIDMYISTCRSWMLNCELKMLDVH